MQRVPSPSIFFAFSIFVGEEIVQLGLWKNAVVVVHVGVRSDCS